MFRCKVRLPFVLTVAIGLPLMLGQLRERKKEMRGTTVVVESAIDDSDEIEAIAEAWHSTHAAQNERSSVMRLQRFAGLVEGRLRVPIPEWWEDLLLHADMHHDGGVAVATGDFWLYDDRQRGGPNVRKGLVADASNGQLRIQIGEDQMAIPEPLLNAARRNGPLDICDAILARDAIYVALVSLSSGPYLLAKLDRLSGAELWRAAVVGEERVLTAGRGYHFLQIQLSSDERVYVFGIRDFCVYIEGFAAKDGAAILRFSSARIGGSEWARLRVKKAAFIAAKKSELFSDKWRTVSCVSWPTASIADLTHSMQRESRKETATPARGGLIWESLRMSGR